MNASDSGGSYNSRRGRQGGRGARGGYGYDSPGGQPQMNRNQYQQQNTYEWGNMHQFKECETRRGSIARSQNRKPWKDGSKQERPQTAQKAPANFKATTECAPMDEIDYDLGPHGAGIPVNEIDAQNFEFS